MPRSTKPLVLCLQAGLRLAENVKACPLLSRGSGAVSDVRAVHTRLGGAFGVYRQSMGSHHHQHHLGTRELLDGLPVGFQCLMGEGE